LYDLYYKYNRSTLERVGVELTLPSLQASAIWSLQSVSFEIEWEGKEKYS